MLFRLHFLYAIFIFTQNHFRELWVNVRTYTFMHLPYADDDNVRRRYFLPKRTLNARVTHPSRRSRRVRNVLSEICSWRRCVNARFRAIIRRPISTPHGYTVARLVLTSRATKIMFIHHACICA